MRYISPYHARNYQFWDILHSKDFCFHLLPFIYVKSYVLSLNHILFRHFFFFSSILTYMHMGNAHTRQQEIITNSEMSTTATKHCIKHQSGTRDDRGSTSTGIMHAHTGWLLMQGTNASMSNAWVECNIKRALIWKVVHHYTSLSIHIGTSYTLTIEDTTKQVVKLPLGTYSL